MLLTCYLVSVALFYFYAAKRAPIEEEIGLTIATEPPKCEVIELFPLPEVRTSEKAA